MNHVLEHAGASSNCVPRSGVCQMEAYRGGNLNVPRTAAPHFDQPGLCRSHPP